MHAPDRESSGGLEAAPRDVIPIQPLPTDLDVGRVELAGEVITIISRDWPPGFTGRCRLCPAGSCMARGRDHCTVVVRDHVPDEGISLFSLADWLAGEVSGRPARRRAARRG